jgi:two-component system sensor histidine kinase HydH
MCGAILSVVEGDRHRKRVDMARRIEWQSLLHSLPEAVFLFDCQGRIVEVNKPAEQLMAQPRSALLGRDTAFLANCGPGAESVQNTGVERALRGEQVRHERSVIHLGPTGQTSLEVLGSASPMHDLQGNIIGAMLVLQDITELSKLQRQVASSERHFAVGQMTAGLAHDFNNVLNSISEAVYVLDMKKERSEHDRTMLHVIDNAVRRGSEIVSNIREYLRGNRQIRERLDTSQVLVEALQLTQPLLESRSDIKLVREFGVAAPVEAVPAELRRVFTNLILNAVEAMPQGGTLSLRCGTNGNWVAASISDTGPGIPADKQKMIFSPYFTTKPKGTGLGLAGARRAINSLGGEIRFESSPGRGTTFYVLLPPAKSQATDTISARSA